MGKGTFITRTLLVCALLCTPEHLLAQSVSLQGSLTVASAEDFATRVLQDPWDMNERTDFGWFLYGSDAPSPDLTNVSFSGGVFSATTGTNPNMFLLETGNPFAARTGKTGYNYPIDANFYRVMAIRMSINGTPQAAFGWNRNDLWDGTTSSSNIFTLSPGWRTYFVDLQTLGIRSGSTTWSGLIRSLQFAPSYLNPYNISIDWIRLGNVDSALCRRVTWSGFAGSIDLYVDTDSTTNGNETVLALNVPVGANGNSAGCSPAGAGGYNFYAGGLAPGTYQVLARTAGSGGAFTRSSTAYVVNNTPILTVTSPTDEGSTDDFATAQLGNAWDMNATSDVEQAFNIHGVSIDQNLPAETPAGTSLGNIRVYSATSDATGGVGDPILQLLSASGGVHQIDPARYRILTVEFGIPNLARNVNQGSIARIVWRTTGGIDYTVTDDIIFNSRANANVLDKIVVDLADRTVLPIEPTSPSQLGWGTGGTIDRFRFDPHEFSAATPFFVKRVKLAALERVDSGNTYTIRWTTTKGGTVTLYYDTDRNEFNGGLTQITSVAAAAGAGSYVWTAPSLTIAPYYIYAVINDNQGNSNTSYSRWPLVIGKAPPVAPPGIRILQ